MECFANEISTGGEDLEDSFVDLLGEDALTEGFTVDGLVAEFSIWGEDFEEHFGLVRGVDFAGFAAVGGGSVTSFST